MTREHPHLRQSVRPNELSTKRVNSSRQLAEKHRKDKTQPGQLVSRPLRRSTYRERSFRNNLEASKPTKSGQTPHNMSEARNWGLTRVSDPVWYSIMDRFAKIREFRVRLRFDARAGWLTRVSVIGLQNDVGGWWIEVGHLLGGFCLLCVWKFRFFMWAVCFYRYG